MRIQTNIKKKTKSHHIRGNNTRGGDAKKEGEKDNEQKKGKPAYGEQGGAVGDGGGLQNKTKTRSRIQSNRNTTTKAT